MASPSLRLHFDILEVISEFLDEASDVISFGLTSNSVHRIATRRLLSMRPIFLTGGPSILAFHRYLFADPFARTPHVRALDLDKAPWPYIVSPHPGDTTRLMEILTSCPNIEHIYIGADADGLVCDLDVVHAIAALRSLRSLAVHGTSMKGPLLFREARDLPPLRVLRLHGPDSESHIWWPVMLDAFLPCLAQTLEKLELDTFTVDDETTRARGIIVTPSVSVFTMTQYPSVRSLSMERLHGFPLLDRLQYLFPALDGELSFGSSTFHADSLPVHYPIIRTVNQRVQGTSRGRPAPWNKVDRLVCDPLILYLLALRCPVRHVLLNASKVPLELYASQALRENPVPHLKLTLRHDHAMFDGVFSPELAKKLTHLTLVLTYEVRWWVGSGEAFPVAPRWRDVLDTTVSSLRPLQKLTHLRLVISSDASGWDMYKSDENVKVLAERAKAYAGAFRGSTFDFAGTAVELVRPLPSLRYVFVATSGSIAAWRGNDDPRAQWEAEERWHVSRAWRVAEHACGAGQPRLVELDNDVAETLIRTEELLLAKTDEPLLQIYARK